MFSENHIPILKENFDKLKQFTSIAFPMVRKVFPSLIANQIVSVQPMSVPSSLLFYTDYVYGKKDIIQKLRKGKIYKIIWDVKGPFPEFIDLYKESNTSAKIGQVPNGAPIIFLRKSEKQDYFRIFYGDQAGWIWANQVWNFRFKRVTARMIRRYERKR